MKLQTKPSTAHYSGCLSTGTLQQFGCGYTNDSGNTPQPTGCHFAPQPTGSHFAPTKGYLPAKQGLSSRCLSGFAKGVGNPYPHYFGNILLPGFSLARLRLSGSSSGCFALGCERTYYVECASWHSPVKSRFSGKSLGLGTLNHSHSKMWTRCRRRPYPLTFSKPWTRSISTVIYLQSRHRNVDYYQNLYLSKAPTTGINNPEVPSSTKLQPTCIINALNALNPNGLNPNGLNPNESIKTDTGTNPHINKKTGFNPMNDSPNAQCAIPTKAPVSSNHASYLSNYENQMIMKLINENFNNFDAKCYVKSKKSKRGERIYLRERRASLLPG